jgi:hypothetical protein
MKVFAKYVGSAALAAALSAWATMASAQHLIGSYEARLSARDHFNSRGERLNSAAAIIRQDRANFHEFGVTDDEDWADEFFHDKRNRDLLERHLANGHAEPRVLRAIVNGTPLIRVDIYRDRHGHFIRVHLL